jgi:NADPH:quinone reductase-like Zn-dependent oxidoreductase
MEGKEFYVEGIGPDVKHLKPGDRVLMTGKQGTDWSYIPGFTNLLIIREGNIGLVLEPLPETEEIK